MHVPLGGSAGDGNNHRNANGKMERRKLRKINAGRRRSDQQQQQHSGQDHKQTKREIRDKVIDSAYYIQSTNVVSQLHDDLQHQQHRNTDDNDGLNYVPSGNRIGRKTMKTKNAFTNQADMGSHGNDDDDDNNNNGDNRRVHENSRSNRIGNSKTMRVTFKLKNGKIAHKIALQRTHNTDNRQRNFGSKAKLNRSDNDSSTESVYTGNDHDKMVMTGQTNSNDDDADSNVGNAMTDTSDSTSNIDTITNVQDTDDFGTKATINHDNDSFSGMKNQLQRFKRKSGKAAGALGRPKGGSDSSSKSTSRKKEGGKWKEQTLFNICWLMFQSS